MSGKTKIQDQAEVRRWFKEGVKLEDMVARYWSKYRIVITKAAFSNLRLRNGWEDLRRHQRGSELLPWREILPEHGGSYDLANLRFEARRRAGLEMRETDRQRLKSWKRELHQSNRVVAYTPESGFHRVKPKPYESLVSMPPPEHRRRRTIRK